MRLEKRQSILDIWGKSVEIDGVKIGTITEVETRQELGKLPVITLQVVTNQEYMADLLDYLYMASIVEGRE